VFSIPAVQTRVGKYVTNWLNEDFDTNITIEKVGLQFNGDVELKNIYVADHKKDTLFNITELNTSIISIKNLYNGKLTFGDIDIIGLTFNLKTYECEIDTNLDVFVAKFDKESTGKKSATFLLSSSDVSIYNGEFRLTDENRETQQIFVFKDLTINATDFLIQGSNVSTRINKFKFRDSHGVQIKNLATNFKYTLQDMTFDNLQIETDNSTLTGNLKFLYKREDLQNFTEKVTINATFIDSDIALSDLNTFYNEFGKDQHVKLNVELSGTLNNLTANDLTLRTARQTLIDGDFNFKNIFNSEESNFVMDANFEKISSTYTDLKALLPNALGNSIPSDLDALGKFTIEGKTRLTSKTIHTDIEIATDLGYIIADLEMNNIDNIDNVTYTGNVILDDFDIGVFIEEEKLGKMSLNVEVNGRGFKAENLSTHVKGDVFYIDFNNYSYNEIKIAGNVKNKIFDGNLVANDKNLNLNFNGLVDFSEEERKYDFTANVDYANFRTLNFAENDSISVFSGRVKINMNASNLDDAYGNVSFKNTLYKNQNDEYYFKDFSITSRSEEGIRYININSPDIIEGSLKGKFKFKDIPKLLENSFGDIYTNYVPKELESNPTTTILEDFPDFLLRFKDSNKRSNPKFSSGIKISSAPAPTPAFNAICPASLPITSTKNKRL